MSNAPQLIVCGEDDKDDQFLFEDTISQVKKNELYSLHFADDGEALIALLEHLPRLPDILFLDLNMPRKDGFECLQQIRASSRFDNMPVVILTTTGESTVIDEAYRLGANLYAQKPISFEEYKNILVVCLCRALGNPAVSPRDTFVVRGV